MKKVIFFYPSLHTGGAEIALLNLLEALPEDRYSIDLQLGSSEGAFFDRIPDHVNVLPLLPQFSPWSDELIEQLRNEGKGDMADVREKVHNSTKDPEFMRLPMHEQDSINWEELKTICPKFTGYDVGIAYSIFSIQVKLLADMVDAPKKIVWVHNDYNTGTSDEQAIRKERVLRSKDFYPKIDTFACLSEQNRNSFVELLPELAPKTFIVPNVLFQERIEKLAGAYYPEEYEFDGYKLFSAVRPTLVKGIDFIVEAAEMMKKQGVHFRWILAGATTDKIKKEEMMEEINKRGLDGIVIHKENISNPYPYFKNCDIYVQPSRSEGRPIAIDEAKILGRPVVATNFSSVGVSVENNVNGVICEMSSKSVAETIIHLLNNKNLREQFSSYLRDYKYDNQLDKYFELLG